MKNNDVKEYSKFIKELAQIIRDEDLAEIEFNNDVKQSTIHIKVTKHKESVHSTPVFMPQHAQTMQSPAQQVANATSSSSSVIDAPIADLSKHIGALLSPMVGVVYTSPNPDAPDFVKIGDSVSQGDTLLLIEAMKVFNPVKAPKSGKIAQILVKSNQVIEYGEVLLVIE